MPLPRHIARALADGFYAHCGAERTYRQVNRIGGHAYPTDEPAAHCSAACAEADAPAA